ncbi:hypothetical protein ACJRPK_06225 [Aquimarina sp. 2-A2]|uniref:hypothetical protein n=1 Tax=Aquimarina sp. 2-A2 TaxID=3382644 RepID=UPI00387F1905
MKTTNTIYKVTFDLIDSLENNYCEWILDIIPLKLLNVFFSELKIEGNNLLNKIIELIIKPFKWFWRKTIRPFFLIISGFKNLVRKLFVNYLVLSIIIFIILISVLNKYEVDYTTSSKLISWIFLLSLIITSFFSFDYDLTKTDKLNINLSVEKLNKLNKIEIDSIKNNIQTLMKRHNKQVVFLNTIIGFIWAFSTISFISHYKKGGYEEFFKLLSEYKYVFIFFICFFLLIRAYSKIYIHIFDVAELACNEASAKIEN